MSEGTAKEGYGVGGEEVDEEQAEGCDGREFEVVGKVVEVVEDG